MVARKSKDENANCTYYKKWIRNIFQRFEQLFFYRVASFDHGSYLLKSRLKFSKSFFSAKTVSIKKLSHENEWNLEGRRKSCKIKIQFEAFSS